MLKKENCKYIDIVLKSELYKVVITSNQWRSTKKNLSEILTLNLIEKINID